MIVSLASCGQKAVAPDEFRTSLVTLPNGKTVRVEVMTRAEDMARGMMFRESLAPGRGMLFIHPAPGPQRYWMYQVKIPLDIVFIGPDRRIVEISANTPPCTTKASECPTFGGSAPAQFVLELGAGEAARNGLSAGQTVTF
jgi:uncharacterized membrane protein (UPF0127 family)